ncbi:tripartite motif-containing protein 16-like [Trichomycterus rosablanca]|uniref:tripartite motif-containing protein 16-like n=1 Tax=Trichomycterus rosablanca TaxID=2290929 RepID=UPI002F35A8F8
MAQAKNSVTQDQFCCPVCLETLKDPVAIPCGHSYCMACINNCWDQEDDKESYSCPQCRETFTPRPAVSKNIVLAEVVENLRKRKSKVPLPTGAEDVGCDSCTGRKYKAVKSCLVCLASYCETHLQPHYESPAFKKHKLVKASRRLQEQICSQHDKLLEVYCRTDQQCICMLCTMDDHKGHDTISAAAERTEKQKQLLKIQKKFQKKIQNREKKLYELINAVESHKSSAQTAVENTEKICTELINSINRRCSEVKELIRDREKAVVSQVEKVLKQLEEEIVDLKKKDAELEELSHTEDPIHFLQSFQSLSAPARSAESPVITISSFLSFDEVTKSVSQLREKVEEFLEEQFKKIPDEVKEVQILPPQTREDFLQYFCRFTLDPNTVNKRLSPSEENKVATCGSSEQSYPDHPDRFDYFLQVLCRESVSGRCYLEVEWSGNDGVYIAVSYKSISRKGRGYECVFGYNDQSWRLLCSPSRFLFLHNNKTTEIPIMPSSSRIGVYVDYRAGTLSFYSVSDTMKLLHRVQTTFTQPLYPGFWVCPGSKVKLFSIALLIGFEGGCSRDKRATLRT